MSDYRGQKEEEAFNDWLEYNRTWLEDEFIECVKMPDGILDDDIPDYVQDHEEEFEKWAYNRWKSIGEA
jgi:hypothetical protein